MPNVFFDVTDAIDVIEWPGRRFARGGEGFRRSAWGLVCAGVDDVGFVGDVDLISFGLPCFAAFC